MKCICRHDKELHLNGKDCHSFACRCQKFEPLEPVVGLADTDEDEEGAIECDECGCLCTCADDNECGQPEANCDCGCTLEGNTENDE